MKRTQEFLAGLKLPGEEIHALEPSKKRFADGGEYRIEIPRVEGPRVLREVLAAAKEFQVPVHRISQGSCVMLLTNSEVVEMARIGTAEKIEVCLFVGPRATFETGAQAFRRRARLATCSTAGRTSTALRGAENRQRSGSGAAPGEGVAQGSERLQGGPICYRSQ